MKYKSTLKKELTKTINKYLIITRVKRSISARIISTLITVLIVWFITGNPFMGLSIGGVDMVIKLIVYYIHESIWEKKITKDIRKIKSKFYKNE